MKNVRKTTSSISIAILILCSLYTTMLLSSFLITRVAAPAIPSTPIGETINVTSGETFVLPFKMTFDEGEVGFFVTTFYWDNNETDPNAPYQNFTYEDFVAKFTDDTSFSGAINVEITKEVPSNYPPGYYRYAVQIYEAYGESKNGDFWLNVTMRAAGQGDSYINHTAGDQNITISKVRCYESSTAEEGPGDTTIHVTGVAAIDVAVLSVTVYSPNHPGIAVIDVFPTWNDLMVDVVVENLGTETINTTVKALRNATLIGSANVNNLASGSNTTVTLGPFSLPLPGWAGPPPASNPSLAIPYPVYTIKGEAQLVGDMNETNNVLDYGNVRVKWPGDADGKKDLAGFWVSIDDLIKLTDAWYAQYGLPPPDPLKAWDPMCDFDGAVGIGEPPGYCEIDDLIILTDWWYKL